MTPANDFQNNLLGGRNWAKSYACVVNTVFDQYKSRSTSVKQTVRDFLFPSQHRKIVWMSSSKRNPAKQCAHLRNRNYSLLPNDAICPRFFAAPNKKKGT
jgi:hypothetical protein